MASEGQFPKIDGDVLYAKDYNATNKLFAAGLLKTLFSLNGSFNAVKPTLTAVAAGTNNMAVQSGSVYTTYANDSSYNGVMDNFNTFDTAKWSSGVGAGAITIDNGFLVVKGDTQNGSTWIKSTGNIFGMAGGNIRLRLGSLVGGNEFYPRISIDDVPIYNGAITNPNYSGATIDIMRMSGSNYYYRFEPYDNNNTFIGWSGLPTASNGILEINIIYGPPGGGGNATGSFFIDFVNYVSGISPNSFRVSGTINTRFEDNLPPS